MLLLKKKKKKVLFHCTDVLDGVDGDNIKLVTSESDLFKQSQQMRRKESWKYLKD